MKVRATQLGFYGETRRQPGAIFDIPEKMFSSKWMEKVEPEDVEKRSPGRPPKVTL